MILKLIIVFYEAVFLQYIGIDVEIDEVLSVEIPSFHGEKRILDFLCKLKDGSLFNVEFQFPKADPEDKLRFFGYNIASQIRHSAIAETMIINFTSRKSGHFEEIIIGKCKKFMPMQFFLGDIDFDKILENIIKKCEQNIKLTGHDEISLMLMCLVKNCTDRFEKLYKITKILKHEDLFDKTKINVIKRVIEIEIDSFLTDDEKRIIKKQLGEVKMTQEESKTFKVIVDQSNDKYIIEIREKGRIEGIIEGRIEGEKRGIIKGEKRGIIKGEENIIRDLLGTMTPEEISQKTRYSLETINQIRENFLTI